MGFTNPEAGVMATRPATAPEIAPSTLGLPFLIHSANDPAERGCGGGEVSGDEGAAGESGGG